MEMPVAINRRIPMAALAARNLHRMVATPSQKRSFEHSIGHLVALLRVDRMRFIAIKAAVDTVHHHHPLDPSERAFRPRALHHP